MGTQFDFLAPCPLPHLMPRRTKADPVAQAFGQAIRDARDARDETLDQVANRMGQSDGRYLGEVERGWHSPTISTAKDIADALGVSLADLVRGL